MTVRAVRRLGRDTGAGRGIFAKDFAFHVDSAANKMRNPHDHAPGRGGAGTIRTERAGRGVARRE